MRRCRAACSAAGVGRADREAGPTSVGCSAERLEVASHAFDGPGVGRGGEMARRLGRRLVEELVDRLVGDRAGVLVVAGEEVRLALRVEIDAERHLDLRLAADEGLRCTRRGCGGRRP